MAAIRWTVTDTYLTGFSSCFWHKLLRPHVDIHTEQGDVRLNSAIQLQPKVIITPTYHKLYQFNQALSNLQHNSLRVPISVYIFQYLSNESYIRPKAPSTPGVPKMPLIFKRYFFNVSFTMETNFFTTISVFSADSLKLTCIVELDTQKKEVFFNHNF